MIRLNKFFTVNGATPPATGEGPPVLLPLDADDQAFALRLRQALGGSGGSPGKTIGQVIADRPAAAEGQVSPASPAHDDGIADGPGGLPAGQHRNEPISDPPARAALPQAAAPAAEPVGQQLDLSQIAVAPSSGGRRAGRVRTRLLGYDPMQSLTADPIEAARAVAAPMRDLFPVGWIVVTRGPGRGSFFPLFNGVSQIGRGEDQPIKLDFGDTSISRSNHAAIAYDDESNGFFLGHGGKANIVRLNDRPVISTETLNDQDLIRIGETTLRFVALCSAAFRWSHDNDGTGAIG